MNNCGKCSGGEVLARFIGPGVGVLNFLFAQGVGNSGQKIAPGFCRGGGKGMVMRLYERFSRNCQKSMFVLAYGHILLNGTPFI